MTPDPLVERIADAYPEAFMRVRMACCDTSSRHIDLNTHAAIVVRDVMDARLHDRLPFGRAAELKAELKRAAAA